MQHMDTHMAEQLSINLWGLQAEATGLVAVCALTATLLCWMLLRLVRRQR